MISGSLFLIILSGIVCIFLFKASPIKKGGELSAKDFEIIELAEDDE